MPGEARIRVEHSAVSFGDVMLRRHVFRHGPAVAVPGYEVVGTIDAVGSGVVRARWRPGRGVRRVRGASRWRRGLGSPSRGRFRGGRVACGDCHAGRGFRGR